MRYDGSVYRVYVGLQQLVWAGSLDWEVGRGDPSAFQCAGSAEEGLVRAGPKPRVRTRSVKLWSVVHSEVQGRRGHGVQP